MKLLKNNTAQYTNDGFLTVAATKIKLATDLIIDAQDKLSQVPTDSYEESKKKLDKVLALLNEI